MRRGVWILKAIVFAAVAVFVMGFVSMQLWNWLIPDLFHGPIITFWQAFGLVVLSRIFFHGLIGGRGHCGGRGHWRKRWQEKLQNMTPEQREEMRKRWGNRCGGGDWHFPKEENPTPTA